jgi:hypothetical protein
LFRAHWTAGRPVGFVRHATHPFRPRSRHQIPRRLRRRPRRPPGAPLRILVGHIVHGRRSLIVLEGWDAAGKGGAIQRLTSGWDPRHYRVWPIAAPTARKKPGTSSGASGTRLPGARRDRRVRPELVRAVLVERVEGFASEAEWRRSYGEINDFEAQQAADGTAIVKLFFHVTQETQDERLSATVAHPWKRWKLSPEDFRNRAKRDAYIVCDGRDVCRDETTARSLAHRRRQQQESGPHRRPDDRRPRSWKRRCPCDPPPIDPEVERLAKKAFG